MSDFQVCSNLKEAPCHKSSRLVLQKAAIIVLRNAASSPRHVEVAIPKHRHMLCTTAEYATFLSLSPQQYINTIYYHLFTVKKYLDQAHKANERGFIFFVALLYIQNVYCM